MIQTKPRAGVERALGRRVHVTAFKPKPQAQPTEADVRRRAFNTRAVEGLSWAAVVNPQKAVPVKRKRKSCVESLILPEIPSRHHGEIPCFAVTVPNHIYNLTDQMDCHDEQHDDCHDEQHDDNGTQYYCIRRIHAYST